MSGLKKRQHYVWRYYLKTWAHNGQIWTLLKNSDGINRFNLMEIAQEHYFYELVEFTEQEEQFLQKLVSGMSHPSVKELNEDFFFAFTSHYKLKRQLNDSKISSEDKAFIENEIRKLEVNLMEDSHGRMEKSGMKLLSVVDNKNYGFLENQNDFFETMMYLFFQYIRTKKMKQNVEKDFKHQPGFSKYWNIISHVMATTMARNYSFAPHINFTFYENHQVRNFLTCDQPIFNILSDHVDQEGNTNEIELYYPLSPKLAVLISFTPKPRHWVVSMLVDEELLDQLNWKVVNYAEEYTFADNKEDLQYYLNIKPLINSGRL